MLHGVIRKIEGTGYAKLLKKVLVRVAPPTPLQMVRHQIRSTVRVMTREIIYRDNFITPRKHHFRLETKYSVIIFCL